MGLGRGGIGIYLCSICPGSRPESNRVTEREEEDEENAGIGGCSIRTIGVYGLQCAVDLQDLTCE